MARWWWNQTVPNPHASETAKNGTLRTQAARPRRPCSHRVNSSSTQGSTTTDALLSAASTNNPKENVPPDAHRPGRPPPARSSANTLPRQNASEIVFLPSAIHATKAMFTGCTANHNAASHAPGNRSFARVAHSRNTSNNPTSRPTQWKPKASPPQSQASNQKTV